MIAKPKARTLEPFARWERDMLEINAGRRGITPRQMERLLAKEAIRRGFIGFAPDAAAPRELREKLAEHGLRFATWDDSTRYPTGRLCAVEADVLVGDHDELEPVRVTQEGVVAEVKMARRSALSGTAHASFGNLGRERDALDAHPDIYLLVVIDEGRVCVITHEEALKVWDFLQAGGEIRRFSLINRGTTLRAAISKAKTGLDLAFPRVRLA